jgi:fatty-acyl-CoA synthase/long-chain acyl-CoA synthetase
MRSSMRAEYLHSLDRHAHRVAVEQDGRSLTYTELRRWSTALAEQLRSCGVGKGSVVALYLHNCIEFVVADIAIAMVGAVKLPVNYMLPVPTVAYLLSRGEVEVIISGSSLSAEAAQATRDARTVVRLEVADGAVPLTAGITPMTRQPDPTAEETEPAADPGVQADDPAAVYFTGGTTGRPKGVLHTQRSTVALHYAQLLEAEITSDDRLLLATPLAHAAGLFAQSALLRGATCVIVDGFDALTAVDTLTTKRITWAFLVPTMIYRILDVLSGQPADGLALRTVVYGAAPITPARLTEALRRFGSVFIQLYGQTESPNWGTRLAKADHDPDRPELLGSCGTASIAADVAIIDDDGAVLPPGEIGEVWLRTPYLLTGYLGDPEATATKFVNGGIRTGDIGSMDTDGYLYLRDRKNDMVISGGMNVYCREVEDVLSQHESVRAVAVIGIPHDDWGESVHAVIVPGDGFDETQLLTWARGQLAAYARPKTVEQVTALPETPFGKIDKKALREPHWVGRARAIG